MDPSNEKSYSTLRIQPQFLNIIIFYEGDERVKTIFNIKSLERP